MAVFKSRRRKQCPRAEPLTFVILGYHRAVYVDILCIYNPPWYLWPNRNVCSEKKILHSAIRSKIFTVFGFTVCYDCYYIQEVPVLYGNSRNIQYNSCISYISEFPTGTHRCRGDNTSWTRAWGGLYPNLSAKWITTRIGEMRIKSSNTHSFN